MEQTKTADYNSTFARNLRELLERHPERGGKTGISAENKTMWLDRAGGVENFDRRVFQNHGRLEVVPEGFEDFAEPGTAISSEGEARFAEVTI